MTMFRAAVLLASLSCCAATGCAVRAPEPTNPRPAFPVPVQPGKTPLVTARQLGEALAQRVEKVPADHRLTSHHVYKLAQRAARKAGLAVDLGDVPDNHDLTPAERQAWVAKFRGWR